LHELTALVFVLHCEDKDKLLSRAGALRGLKDYLRTSSLCHASIVKQFGFFSDREHIYLTEEYLPGHTLDYHIKHSTGWLGEQAVGPIVCELLSSVEYIRKVKQAHCTISPELILYSMVSLPSIQNNCKFKR
jgi:serine/threonine protein kinase